MMNQDRAIAQRLIRLDNRLRRRALNERNYQTLTSIRNMIDRTETIIARRYGLNVWELSRTI